MAEWGPALLAQSLRSLRGVGPRRAQDLEAAGLVTFGDLLHRLPLRYEDRASTVPIARLVAGASSAVRGRVVRSGFRPARRGGISIVEVTITDDTGTASALWFNQRFMRDVFGRDDDVWLFGKVDRRGPAVHVLNPTWEVLRRGLGPAADGPPEDEPASGGDGNAAGVHLGRIVPVHERVGTLTPKVLRSLVYRVLEQLPPGTDDPLPPLLRERRGWPALGEALRHAHFPPPGADLALLNGYRHPAQQRLIYDEFLAFQLGLLLDRRDRRGERKPHRIVVDERVRAAARRVLPFALTPGQKTAVREIVSDLQRPAPMNRLLQGEVGAGKTVVALLSALVVLENGLQAVVMAPTEILAEQHYRTLARLLTPTRHRAAVLSGSTPPGERRALLHGVASRHVGLLVGTHALLEDDVNFRALGLVVIDEQHRFGVVHRARLREKGLCPDVLVMTATPIPRTLALTVYGDLDVSVIHDRPPGRTEVQTVVQSAAQRERVYEVLRAAFSAGRQAYIVYPLVEESDRVDLRAATAMADHLATEVFPDVRVGLLHGRLTAEAKDRVMTAFAAGQVQLLVSTTVVEVGVDVPNATAMVIEHAERFGLAQLHQLRGRVGRGTHASTCVLVYEPPLSDEARERLTAIATTTDGFAIAERDLALRGAGDFFGTRQAGRPVFRAADLQRDAALLVQAREDAAAWLAAGAESDPVVAAVRDTWRRRFGLAGVG
jgi:ATP-dependent DNA helicase RecG